LVQSAAGVVLDGSGAAVVHAEVTLTNSQGHVVRHASTNGTGAYSLPSVPPGVYTLTVEAGGFAQYKTTVTVTATQNLTVNVKLKLESATQTVTVKAESAPLEEVTNVGKTGTMIQDIPSSIQIIGSRRFAEQGSLSLRDTIRNASGIIQGGTDGFGFGDKFQIRGVEARIYNDGFSDGDARNGIQHSLNGVERIEILEGPGSALFGSGPPGGTINMVHFLPSAIPSFGATFHTGSFGLYSGSVFATGPTGLQGLDYRIDGLAQHEDGYRALESSDYEFRPEISWSVGNHFIVVSADGRDLNAIPDPAGLIYVNAANPVTTSATTGGTPISGGGVTRTSKYSTPFSLGDQTLGRLIASDTWVAKPNLTVTNHFSYMYRNLSILRNGDSGTFSFNVFTNKVQLTGRTLRKQHDVLNDLDYEAEPVWKFTTGGMHHTLLTGFEAQYQDIYVNRATTPASGTGPIPVTGALPVIADIFNPVVTETSTAGLMFIPNFHDELRAYYYGLYATDQIDITDKWKLRIGGREDAFMTELRPLLFIANRQLANGVLIEPPAIYPRNDYPFSWNVGTVYRIHPGISTYVGVAHSNLANFSSEATQNGVQAPENGNQYEGGVKGEVLQGRLNFTAAGFDVSRNNVFSLSPAELPIFSNQKTFGFEANVEATVAHNWHLSANTTIEHAILTYNPSTPAGVGHRPIGVPSRIFNFWTTYDFHIARASGFRIGGGIAARDRMFGNVQNTYSIPDYVTLDSVFSYNSKLCNLTVGVRNITNQLWFSAANGAGGFVGDPRSYFLEAKKTFGRR
jgi:iron complex outermembrane receptor protein